MRVFVGIATKGDVCCVYGRGEGERFTYCQQEDDVSLPFWCVFLCVCCVAQKRE